MNRALKRSNFLYPKIRYVSKALQAVPAVQDWAAHVLQCATGHEELTYLDPRISLVCWLHYRLAGLMVKASASGAEDPGFESRWRRDFSGSSHISDLNTGTPVAALPGAWRYSVSPGTSRSGVCILWLGEMESSIYSFYLSVAARKIVWADPSVRYTSLLLGR